MQATPTPANLSGSLQNPPPDQSTKNPATQPETAEPKDYLQISFSHSQSETPLDAPQDKPQNDSEAPKAEDSNKENESFFQRLPSTSLDCKESLLAQGGHSPKFQASQDSEFRDEIRNMPHFPESQEGFQKSQTLISFGDDMDFFQSEENTQKSVGDFHRPQFLQSQDNRSVITNSQTSFIRLMSQNERDDGVSVYHDESAQSSQVFERSQPFRNYGRPPVELLRSDSNFMFGPRYRTKALDPTVSPIKKSERKDYSKGPIPAYDDKNPDYEREEKDRRKSLSRLSLSSKKPTAADVIRQQSDVSFQNLFADSQPSGINEESSNSMATNEAFQRTFRAALENEDVQKETQEAMTPLFERVLAEESRAEEEDKIEEEVKQVEKPTSAVKNVLKERNSEGKESVEGKKKTSLSKKVQVQKVDPEDKENVPVSMEVETRRCEKFEEGFASPVNRSFFDKLVIEEESSQKKSAESMLEEVENQQTPPKTLSKQSRRASDLEFDQQKSPVEGNQEDSSMIIETSGSGFEERMRQSMETTRKLTYMERKLKAIQDENRKAMGDFEFKKSLSKLEREKLEIEKGKNPFMWTSQKKVEKPKESTFMSDTKKHYSKLQLEKMAKSPIKNFENETANPKLLTPNSHSFRFPLQMIQMSGEKDKGKDQDKENMQETGNLSEIFTPKSKSFEKKRKFDLISPAPEGENLMNSVDRTNSFKRVKRSDLKDVESLEEMLAKSKKKLPRIQIEKQLSKEREKLKKEQELKEMNLKDVVFKVDNPLMFAKEINLSQSTQSSGRRQKEVSGERRLSGIGLKPR